MADTNIQCAPHALEPVNDYKEEHSCFGKIHVQVVGETAESEISKAEFRKGNRGGKQNNNEGRERFLEQEDGREVVPPAMCRKVAEEESCVTAGGTLEDHKQAVEVLPERTKKFVFNEGDVQVNKRSRFKGRKDRRNIGKLPLGRVVQDKQKIDGVDYGGGDDEREKQAFHRNYEFTGGDAVDSRDNDKKRNKENIGEFHEKRRSQSETGERCHFPRGMSEHLCEGEC